MKKKVRIGAFISGGGTNLQAIIDACESGNIDGEMVFVGSDNPNAKGLQRAGKRGIPTFTTDYASIIRSVRESPEKVVLPGDFNIDDLFSKQSFFSPHFDIEKMKVFMVTRVIAEADMLEKMKDYPFDLIVLAGFMRTLSPYFIDKVNTDSDCPRIMNIHPAILPAFPGTDGYGGTFRYGCKIGGCTVHFIDYGEDTGPIIGQKAFPIYEEDTLENVRERGLKLEWELYPECIQLYAQGRLKTVKMSYTLENGKKTEKTVVKII